MGSSSVVTPPGAAPGGTKDPRRQIHFRTDNVEPPSQFYIDVNDQLCLQLNSSDALFGVLMNYRIMQPDGSVTQGQETRVVAAGNRATNTFFFNLPEGFLLSIQIGANTGTLRRGANFVRLLILRGTQSTGFFSSVLCQGYVDGESSLSWPIGRMEGSCDGQGLIRSISGTSPAAGAEISETVPTLARWLLLTFRFVLVTSVTVANRYPQLLIDDGVNPVMQIDGQRVIPASSTFGLNFGAGVPFRQSPGNVNDTLALPVPIKLLPGWRIRTSTNLIQAGDQYSTPQYVVEEWVTP